MALAYENENLLAYALEARKAKQEWEAAQNFFNNVSDPELLDYAIYDIEAAKRKYQYLIRKARGEFEVNQE